MNKKYNKIKTFLIFAIVTNVVFSQFNYPHLLDTMVDSDGEELVGPYDVNYSWSPPQDEYGLEIYVSHIQDNGNGDVVFTISYGNGNYFRSFNSFNIALNSTEADFVITDIDGGITGAAEIYEDLNSNGAYDNDEPFLDCGIGLQEYICDGDDGWDPSYGNGQWDDALGWTIMNLGSNIIFGSNQDLFGGDPVSPISVGDCDDNCTLFHIFGTYNASYDNDNQDDDGNIVPVFISQDPQVTEIFNTSPDIPIAEYQWMPGMWTPGLIYSGSPENYNCSCNSDFISCPYDCTTPYQYEVYRFEYDDLNGDKEMNFNEEDSATEPISIGMVEISDEPYDVYNLDAYAYFIDSGLQPEQGYCYFVRALHPSIRYGETSLDDALEQKMCTATECITAIFYEDQDNDGLGDPDNSTQPQCGAPSGYVPNNHDRYPLCPNILGDINICDDDDNDGECDDDDPYDCNNDCFDWNSDIVETHFDPLWCNDPSGCTEWGLLDTTLINQTQYNIMKSNFCWDNELVRGCAVEEHVENHHPADQPYDDSCPGYCALGNSGNELSYFEDVSDYEDNGSPIYEFGGARDCSGSCGTCLNENDDGICDEFIPTAWLDDCGWCCSCNTDEGEDCD